MSASPNVDPAELDKFSELAHRWWDPASEFRPLHEINPLRLEWIDRHAALSGKAVLDVGCGGGILAEAMASCGAHVTGIDLADKALKVARLHLRESLLPVLYESSSAEEYAETHARAFEVVTCMEMLEHVPDPASTVAACARMIAPGGQAFFSTINRNPKSYMFAVVGAEYVLKLLPKGTHDYARLIKPHELARWCRGAGLRPQEVIGMTYSPFSRRYSLGSDCSVNYLLRCARDD
jgi:2-polyprenyl-6-hydroxyphenyl methylase / 3-demethylubiquinone-9 3-methyltransferase